MENVNRFLPINLEQLQEKFNTNVPDFVVVTGDAYVDASSFGAAIIGRVLEAQGFSIGIIAQPNFKNKDSFAVFGKPRYGFLVTAGNIDSMVNHYYVSKKRREKDLYSPNGKAGLRPDRATIVYCNKIREMYKDASIIIGGIEASLRRLSHYDYWDDKIRRSILLDSTADLLVYGMAETAIVEVATALESGIPVSEVTFVNGTVYKTIDLERPVDYIMLPKYTEVVGDKKAFAKSFVAQYENTDHITARTLVEQYDDIYVVQNVPAAPITTAQFDSVYALPYANDTHPIYAEQGGVPAITEVKFSLISNRGCFGNCNFCALTFHQGKVVQSRSHASLVNEATKMTWEPDFKGYIHDVGGPTANFRGPSCDKQLTKGTCKNLRCLAPTPCKNLKVDHSDYLKLLRKLREIPKIKKVFVRSGLRFDYIMLDKNDDFLRELSEHHISGQLKVAPEHVSKNVLDAMGKAPHNVYKKFVEKYTKINKELYKNQFLVPYLMSSHPGSTLENAIELAEYLRDSGIYPEQVQDFYPTPGTYSTAVYYLEADPITKERVYVAKTPRDKAMQRALIQYRLPKNYDIVLDALRAAKRLDLIGFDKKCLIRPRRMNVPQTNQKTTKVAPKKKTIRNLHKKVK